MQVLIADGDLRHTELFVNAFRIVAADSPCYVCDHPQYLPDFLQNFSLDLVFAGSFGDLMTAEEIVASVRQFHAHMKIVLYATALSPQERDDYERLGCHAILETSGDLRRVVERLQLMLNKIS